MKNKEYQNFFIPDNCIYEYLVQLCNKSTRKPWKKTNDTTCTKTFLIFDNCIYEHLVHQLENHEKNIAITIFDPWQLHLWVFSQFFFLLYLQTTLVCPYLILFCSLNLNLKSAAYIFETKSRL